MDTKLKTNTRSSLLNKLIENKSIVDLRTMRTNASVLYFSKKKHADTVWVRLAYVRHIDTQL